MKEEKRGSSPQSLANLKSFKANEIPREQQLLKILPSTRDKLKSLAAQYNKSISSVVDELVANQDLKTQLKEEKALEDKDLEEALNKVHAGLLNTSKAEAIAKLDNGILYYTANPSGMLLKACEIIRKEVEAEAEPED